MINATQQNVIPYETKREQISNDNIAIAQPIDIDKETVMQHTHTHKVTEKDQQMMMNGKTYEDALQEILMLVGLQKKIHFYVAQRCILNENLRSGPITMDMLKTATGATDKCIKTSIHRLVRRGVFEREKGKKGLGGFCIFRINDPMRRAVIHDMQMALASNQNVTHKVTNTPPSSSIIYINNTTTTTSAEDSGEDPGDDPWQDIDISSLADINFTKHCLLQLKQQGKLTPKDVQESIWAYDFDLRENEKGKRVHGNPLNYFMGILRKGVPYIPSKNYVSPEEKLLEKYLTRQRLAHAHRKKMEEEAQDLACAEWLQDVSQDKIQEIIPERRYQEEPFRSGMLKDYFKKNIWPGILSGVLKGASEKI